MPRKRQRNPFAGCLVLFWLMAVAALLLAAVGLLAIPAKAEMEFGPPTRRISSLQAVGYSILLVLQSRDLTTPADPLGQTSTFTVDPNEPARSIINRLEREGLISNPDAFRVYLTYSGLDTSLQSGLFNLSPAMTPLEIAGALQDATPETVDFVVLPGWRMEEIAASLPTSGLSITPTQFIVTARSRPADFAFQHLLPEPVSVEGFLFPDTYVISRTVAAPDLISVMLENFERNLTVELQDGFDRQGINVYEAVTLASLVEREAVVTEEMSLIASVFYNRLEQGIKLDSDPTVQYALGFNTAQDTWWTNPLSLENLQFSSVYNTYLYPGLPPGPIANPGPEALRAVAFPAQAPYFFFRAGCDGTGRHLFSETFEEHLQKACP